MKFTGTFFTKNENQSPPSRGAWIEIISTPCVAVASSVAPLAGGVD